MSFFSSEGPRKLGTVLAFLGFLLIMSDVLLRMIGYRAGDWLFATAMFIGMLGLALMGRAFFRQFHK